MNRFTGMIATIWLMLAGSAWAGDNPVVVELYTSQGCSSCPPADAYFLDQLTKRDDVIALALHVDYWDYIGWKDEFADPAYTARQKAYARAAGHRSVYTPQMVVNGRDHVVGTHPDQVEGLIKTHKAKSSPVVVSITRDGNRVRISATSSERMPMQVHVVRYKRQERVSIKRGENAGRAVTYGNIVEAWDTVRDWNGAQPLTLHANAKGEAPVVVLIQQIKGGPIMAAAHLN